MKKVSFSENLVTVIPPHVRGSEVCHPVGNPIRSPKRVSFSENLVTVIPPHVRGSEVCHPVGNPIRSPKRVSFSENLVTVYSLEDNPKGVLRVCAQSGSSPGKEKIKPLFKVVKRLKFETECTVVGTSGLKDGLEVAERAFTPTTGFASRTCSPLNGKIYYSKKKVTFNDLVVEIKDFNNEMSDSSEATDISLSANVDLGVNSSLMDEGVDFPILGENDWPRENLVVCRKACLRKSTLNVEVVKPVKKSVKWKDIVQVIIDQEVTIGNDSQVNKKLVMDEEMGHKLNEKDIEEAFEYLRSSGCVLEGTERMLRHMLRILGCEPGGYTYFNCCSCSYYSTLNGEGAMEQGVELDVHRVCAMRIATWLFACYDVLEKKGLVEDPLWVCSAGSIVIVGDSSSHGTLMMLVVKETDGFFCSWVIDRRLGLVGFGLTLLMGIYMMVFGIGLIALDLVVGFCKVQVMCHAKWYGSNGLESSGVGIVFSALDIASSCYVCTAGYGSCNIGRPIRSSHGSFENADALQVPAVVFSDIDEDTDNLVVQMHNCSSCNAYNMSLQKEWSDMQRFALGVMMPPWHSYFVF